MTLWKLHGDLTHLLVVLGGLPGPRRQEQQQQVEQLPEEDVRAVELLDDLPPLQRSQSMCLPANTSMACSDWEVSFIPSWSSLQI